MWVVSMSGLEDAIIGPVEVSRPKLDENQRRVRVNGRVVNETVVEQRIVGRRDSNEVAERELAMLRHLRELALQFDAASARVDTRTFGRVDLLSDDLDGLSQAAAYQQEG